MEENCCRSHKHDLQSFLLLYQLSYLAIVAAYNGQSLQWKSNWVEFHIHRKKVYWEFVLIRWTINGLIAGGGFEPPFSRIWVLWDSVSLSCDIRELSAYLYRQPTSRLFLTSRTASSYPVFLYRAMGKVGFEPTGNLAVPDVLPPISAFPEPGQSGLAICLSCYAFH